MQLLMNRCPHCQITVAWSYDQIEEDRCSYCFSKLEPSWKENMRSSPAEHRTSASLAKWLDDAEIVHYENIKVAVAVGQAGIALMAQQENEEYQMRARLILIGALMRQGQLAESGITIRNINKWAVEHSNNVVLARSFRQLATFFLRLRDGTSALEYALNAIAYLPENTMPQIRGNHLMTLAVALSHSGDLEEAHRRYEEILDVCEATGNVRTSLYALNNLAYSMSELGRMQKAEQLAARMMDILKKHDLPPVPFQLDTVSQIDLRIGKPETAVRLLKPLPDLYREGQLLGDVFSFFEGQITLSQALRQLGEYDQAQATLTQLKGFCEEKEAGGFLVRIKLEQAQLYAATDRYKEAYETFRDYHEELEKQRSDEREARSQILHTVFETNEARRSSEHYRELSLRDPLTGLYNRRFIDAHMEDLLSHLGSEQPITAVLIDLDHFKRINDTMSHEAGDAVLVQLAKLLDAAAIEPAKAARLGGEEFLIICPGYDAAKGLEFAERVCELIRSSDWSSIIGEMNVTASIGVSTSNAGRTTSAALFAEADRHLYLAKRKGRNRVAASAD